MKNILDILSRTFGKNTFFIVFVVLLLCIPNIILSSLTKRYLIFNIGFTYLWVLCELVIRIAKKYTNRQYKVTLNIIKCIKILVIVLVSILCVTNVFLIYHFNTVLNAYFLLLLSQTNASESSEFLNTYLFTGISIKIGFIYLGALIFALVFHLINYRIRANWLYKIVKGTEIFLAITFTVFCLKFISLTKYLGRDYIECYRNSYLIHNPIFVAINSLWQFADIRKSFEMASMNNKNYTEDGLTNEMQPDERIVLVIGESYNKHHSSLYGYDHHTNPQLEKWDLVVFTNVISCANSTSVAMNYIFSPVLVNDSSKWYEAPFFPSVFKESGCPVYFWSNQFCPSKTSRSVWEVNGNFLNMRDISNNNFSLRNKKLYKYDEDIVKSFTSTRDSLKEKKSLDIIHLMGSHVAPEDRYPADYSIFKGGDYSTRTDLTQKQQQQIANYDNSILYNDFILGKILEYYKNKNSIVIYLADHGDEANDFRAHIGRAFDFNEIGEKVFHCQLDIPFIVYMSPTYKQNHPKITEKIYKCKDYPLVSDQVGQLLFNIAGIKSVWYKPGYSPINSKYQHKKRYFINPANEECIDYDLYCKTKP